MNHKTSYIVFEGMNGCGKGTQMISFAKRLYDSSRDRLVSLVRTPNALDAYGVLARSQLREGDAYSNRLEAVRNFGRNHVTTADHITTLQQLGHAVIADRNYCSTFAFQGAQGVPYQEIASAVRGAKIPDITFLFDLPVELAIQRLEGRIDGEGRRKFDSDNEFMEQVRRKYLYLKDELPVLIGDESIFLLNGGLSPEELASIVWEAYERSL